MAGLPSKPESLTFHDRVSFRWESSIPLPIANKIPYLDVLSLSPVVNISGSNLAVPGDVLTKILKIVLLSLIPVAGQKQYLRFVRPIYLLFSRKLLKKFRKEDGKERIS